MPVLSGAFFLLLLLCEMDAGDLGGQHREGEGTEKTGTSGSSRGFQLPPWHIWAPQTSPGSLQTPALEGGQERRVRSCEQGASASPFLPHLLLCPPVGAFPNMIHGGWRVTWELFKGPQKSLLWTGSGFQTYCLTAGTKLPFGVLDAGY